MNTITVSKKDGTQTIPPVYGLKEVCDFIDTADRVVLAFLHKLLELKIKG